MSIAKDLFEKHPPPWGIEHITDRPGHVHVYDADRNYMLSVYQGRTPEDFEQSKRIAEAICHLANRHTAMMRYLIDFVQAVDKLDYDFMISEAAATSIDTKTGVIEHGKATVERNDCGPDILFDLVEGVRRDFPGTFPELSAIYEDSGLTEREKETIYEATDAGKAHFEREKKVERLIDAVKRTKHSLVVEDAARREGKPTTRDAGYYNDHHLEIQDLQAALDALKGDA